MEGNAAKPPICTKIWAVFEQFRAETESRELTTDNLQLLYRRRQNGNTIAIANPIASTSATPIRL